MQNVYCVRSPCGRSNVLALFACCISGVALPTCGNLEPGARLLEVTLQRCLQRCRDAASGCERVAYNDAEQACAIDVAAEGCGTGWTVHSRSVDFCGYGRGRASPACSCTTCQPGAASHALLLGLAGAWRLEDSASSGVSAGRLEIDKGGVATYSSGVQGQFVLWHPRDDMRYPGAFYLEHIVHPAGHFAGWDYAWFEDGTAGHLRLVVRRFCGAGPVQCGNAVSPEGSASFERTLIGYREADVEPPCAHLEGGELPNAAQGTCCAASEEVAGASTQEFVAAVEVVSCANGGAMRWSDLILKNATWNQDDVGLLQNAHVVMSSTDPKLCGRNSNGALAVGINGIVVAFALRGDCSFAEKAHSAREAGASAVIIANSQGSALPGELLLGTGEPTPSVPAWMIEAGVGAELQAALGGGGKLLSFGRRGVVSESSSRRVCCDATCYARVQRSFAAGRAGGVDVSGTCANVDCTGYTVVASAELPHSTGNCESCPRGLAAIVDGRASCGRCPDGHVGSADGRSCQPCPSGSAGVGGKCSSCTTGLVPDSARRSCVVASGNPVPVPMPVPSVRPTPVSMNPIPTPSTVYVQVALPTESGGDVGKIIGFVVIFILFCVCVGCISGVGCWYNKFTVTGTWNEAWSGVNSGMASTFGSGLSSWLPSAKANTSSASGSTAGGGAGSSNARDEEAATDAPSQGGTGVANTSSAKPVASSGSAPEGGSAAAKAKSPAPGGSSSSTDGAAPREEAPPPARPATSRNPGRSEAAAEQQRMSRSEQQRSGIGAQNGMM